MEACRTYIADDGNREWFIGVFLGHSRVFAAIRGFGLDELRFQVAFTCLVITGRGNINLGNN